MVDGIRIFKDHFIDHLDKFVIVGGVACHIIHEDRGLEFRTTRDFDIVILTDKVDREFSNIFLEFIKKGSYTHLEKSTGEKQFYRFYKPVSNDFPYMLELFSVLPEFLDEDELPGKKIKLTDKSDMISLSAILMLKEYYSLIEDNVVLLEGLPVVEENVLIPLKARAYIDLSKRRESGEKIDSRDIKKHRNDVFKLLMLLNESAKMEIDDSVKNDMREFIENISKEKLDLKSLGIKKRTKEELMEFIKSFYGL